MTSRNQSLDVLRFAAVLMVFCCHFPLFPAMKYGSYGVDLFFVISGFLISGLLFSELRTIGDIRYGRFLLRRGFKIYPSFYFFVAVTAVCFPWVRPHWRYEALFLQNYILIPMPNGSTWSHLWSLAVEEHFYIALPLLLILLNRTRLLRLSTVAGIWLALAVSCFILRVLHGTAPLQTHLRVDALFTGVLIGYIYHFHHERFRVFSRRWMLPIGIIFASAPLIVLGESVLSTSAALSSTMIGFGLIVWWAIPRDIPYSATLAEIGRYSYSIYLWQMPIAMFYHSHSQNMFTFSGFVVTSIAIGTAMAVIVEMPAIALRDRLMSAERKDELQMAVLGARH